MVESTNPSSRSESVATVRAAARHILERSGRSPEIGLVLGSGLDRVVESLESQIVFPYAEISGCPTATVPGHPGRLVLGRLGGREVAGLVGRVHHYEGYSPEDVVYLVRLLHALGCRTLVVTNAAGGLDPSFRAGDLMLITDQIYLPGLAGQSPLRGPAGAAFGPRFVDMRDAFDPDLRRIARETAASLGQTLREGVYVMVGGPSYETPAEARFLRTIGADAVGMSTAPEVVAARQLGIRVLGLSLITNSASGLDLSHEEVVAAGLAAGPRVARLIASVVERLPGEDAAPRSPERRADPQLSSEAVE